MKKVAQRRKKDKSLPSALKSSFWYENHLIQRDLAEGVVSGYRESGLRQYHLGRRDCADFVDSAVDDRLNFAVENGLFPPQDV